MEPSTSSEQQNLKEIFAGTYRDYYLIYNRKSTDDPDTQKNSIKYQKAENTRFAARVGLPLAPITIEGFVRDGIISERHSAFKEHIELVFGSDNTVQYRIDRPKFHRLALMLSKGYFKGVIFLSWDRASRNKGDNSVLEKLIKAGADVRFSWAHYDNTSAGALHRGIDGIFSEHHSRVTAEKVSMTIAESRARGLCTNRAPVGYLNPGNMERKPLDPVRAPIIKQLFEKAATGEWTLADLARWAIEQNFTMQPMRRRKTKEEKSMEDETDVDFHISPICRLPTANSIHKILTRPFYTGKVPGGNGTWVRSTSHEALISEELFNTVQKMLRTRNTSAHYLDRLPHPLRGVVRCAGCRRLYTPYMQKGITYYGARCDERCTNPMKSCNFDFISDKMLHLIEKLSFTPQEFEEINARMDTDVAALDASRTIERESNERKKKKLREDLSYLAGNKTTLLRTGAYTPEGLVEEEARLNRALSVIDEADTVSEASLQEIIRDVLTLSELLKRVVSTYSLALPREKERYIKIVVSELFLSKNTFDYRCTKGFEPLLGRFIPNCDLIGWLSELAYQKDTIKAAIEKLRMST